MSINSESDITTNLQIGPTTLGMVRIFIEGDGIDLPMDFDPEEADEIAEEIRAAALRARRRRRRPPQTASLGDNIGAAARNVTAVIGAAATALEAFRQVSTNSDEIIRDFSNAADRLHEFLNTRSGDTPEREAEAERTENDKRMRNL